MINKINAVSWSVKTRVRCLVTCFGPASSGYSWTIHKILKIDLFTVNGTSIGYPKYIQLWFSLFPVQSTSDGYPQDIYIWNTTNPM